MDHTQVFAAPASILIILQVVEPLRQKEPTKKLARMFDALTYPMGTPEQRAEVTKAQKKTTTALFS